MSEPTNLAKLADLVKSTEIDYQKAMNGNKQAGVRVRKAMQEVKKLATLIRAEARPPITEPEQV